MKIIAIRREDSAKEGESRAPLTPKEVEELISSGYKVIVQPAVDPETGENKRAFSDREYIEVGAELSEDISRGEIILGIKEIEPKKIIPEKFYLFFSHTHKGQEKNRPMLRTLVEKKTSLIDFELVTDENGQRIITAFTYFAGYAGMINTLWTLGQKLKTMGIDSPFQQIPQSIEGQSLQQLKEMLRNEIAPAIERRGTPPELPPIITVFLGRGRTSRAAQEIYSLLPTEKITPEQLRDTFQNGARNRIYALELEVYEMYRLKPQYRELSEKLEKESEKVRFEHYIKNPEYYESNLDQILPYTTVLMNCIYWEPKYPRVLPTALLRELVEKGESSLLVIGDISCDPNGGIEFSKETWIDRPVFTFNPLSGESRDGFEGEGVSVMAITNLPCELPRESSTEFARQLFPILKDFLKVDLKNSENPPDKIPEPFKRGLILWRGKFTPTYRYMEKFL